MQITELHPRFDARKSFYGKAHLNKHDDEITLLSYNTIVAQINTRLKEVTLLELWDSSATTLRHVKEFLRQYGFKAETKKQIARDYL